ncbi:hypothetical protein PQR66_30210 [Paraburkholderia agricolaris]|jgi:hypothetical protein|uniref:Uncharacterized protein n=1 Tax=Paraburkholderia agricolaris TaxID=2152888 RepID=A0ABW8ZVR8_9BURK
MSKLLHQRSAFPASALSDFERFLLTMALQGAPARLIHVMHGRDAK